MKARPMLAALAALAVAPSAALAAGPANAPEPPGVELPGDAVAARTDADPRTWIVGVRAGGGALARAHGAERIAGRAWLVRRGRARALAAALRSRGLLDYAEPDRLVHVAQAPAPDPLSGFASWRDFVVGSAVPPPVTPDSPLIGVVDTMIDVTHPEIAGSNITAAPARELRDDHGTATSTIAAAAANGVGFLGIWPGARTFNVPLAVDGGISCSDSARGIAGAIRAGAAVINMSYGAVVRCATEEQQILRAVKAGAVPVAASGNDFQSGNPLEYPASLAHVITVAAIDPAGNPTGFSSESGAVDLSAPGIGIFTAVPARFDRDGTRDGFTYHAGTSFAAPMVAAAIAWVRAARPDLTPYQAAQVVRIGTRDVGEPGYENATGFGALDLPTALAREAPTDDPQEPNDDFRYVNGRAFGKPAQPLYRGRPNVVAATADYAEDPVDIYRVRIPARRRVRLSLIPAVGDPDLFVFGARARELRSSSKTGDATERLTIRNRRFRTRTVYVAVGFDPRKEIRLFNASYLLRAR